MPSRRNHSLRKSAPRRSPARVEGAAAHRSRTRLRPADLTWNCRAGCLRFRTTQDLKPLEGTIGQDKAVRALRLGLSLNAPGYNVFVTGLTGTRKTRTIREILGRVQPWCPAPPDRVYVHNFRDPDRPVLITLPRGAASSFRHEVADTIQYLREHLTQLFLGDEFHKKRQGVQAAYETQANELFTDLGRRMEKDGFALVQVQSGALLKPEIVPAIQGEPVGADRLEEMVARGELSPQEVERREAKYPAYRAQLDNLLRKNLKMHRAFREDLRSLEQREARPVVEETIRELYARYPHEKVLQYCDQMRDHILQNLTRFVSGDSPEGEEFGTLAGGKDAPLFPEYHVNVVLDNRGRKGCPLVIETAPTFQNLFGTIERPAERPLAGATDFTRIKAGSILQADGGYLVLNAFDVLAETGVWKTLKRALVHQQLEIQPPEAALALAPVALKPEPIQVQVKVILVGDLELFYALWEMDEVFRKIFKVRVDFDSTIPVSEESLHGLAAFVSRIVREEHLPHFTREAVAEIATEAVRTAGHKGKMTAALSSVSDLVREAAYWRGPGPGAVSADHVRKAILEAEDRSNLIEERMHEMFQDGSILIETDGERVGVVNGLSVYDLGNYVFGRPARISAAIAAGRGGVLNVEREAELSGRTHDKGVLILTGFLRERFAQERPLSLAASLCFEQSYSEIDGDSASSAELYALLSALSGVPIRQDLAVTGSVNQKGEIQPIGGVNEKIEGFYRVCRTRGLTGTQGVLIPRANVNNLVLREEIVSAVRRGVFHVHAIDHVDEGIRILTGVPAGRLDRRGLWTRGSINDLVDARLADYAEKVKEFGPEEGGGEGE